MVREAWPALPLQPPPQMTRRGNVPLPDVVIVGSSNSAAHADAEGRGAGGPPGGSHENAAFRLTQVTEAELASTQLKPQPSDRLKFDSSPAPLWGVCMCLVLHHCFCSTLKHLVGDPSDRRQQQMWWERVGGPRRQG